MRCVGIFLIYKCRKPDTPTRIFHAKHQGKLVEEIPKEEQKDEVYFSEDGMLIGIDCACGFDGRLTCLCLDTGEVVYA